MVKYRAPLALALVVTLAGCAGAGGLIHRSRPDEMSVAREAPLVVPPDFGLTPPRPGAPRPEDADTKSDVLEALFGGPAPRSPSEAAVIGQAGTADDGIRSVVGDPKTVVVNKGETTRDIVSAPQGDGREAQSAIPGS